LPIQVTFTCAVAFVGVIVNAAVGVTVADELSWNTSSAVTS